MRQLINFLIRLINYRLYIDDLEGDNEMKKKWVAEIGEKQLTDTTDFDIPELGADNLPEVSKELEKKEFTTRMKALSEEELEWLMEVIPLELCLKKIEQEVVKVEEYKKVMRDMSRAFG